MNTPMRRTGGAGAPLATPFRTPVRFNRPMPGTPMSDDQQFHTPSERLATPKGKWINPDAQKVLDDRAQRPGEAQSAKRLRVNVLFLAGLGALSHTGALGSLKSWLGGGTAVETVWSVVKWVVLTGLAYNIGEAMWYLMQPKNEYTGLAMTPAQRRGIGLDTNVKGMSAARPARAPQMTPARVMPMGREPGTGVTDIETIRRLPKGLRQNGAAPLTVRSQPAVALQATGNAGYSTDADMATLLQVLNTAPKQSTVGKGTARSIFADASSNLFASRPAPAATALFAGASTGMFGVGGASSSLAPAPAQPAQAAAVGVYQTAPPAPRPKAKDGAKGSGKDSAEGDLEYLEPLGVLESLGVEHQITDWVENMHAWFVRHLLAPLATQMADLDAVFEQNAMGHLSCRQAVMDYAALEQAQSAVANPPASRFIGFQSTASQPQGPPQTLVDLQMRFGETPLGKERLVLEKYLQVPGAKSREYVVSRVRELAQSGAMPAYRFDGGGSYTDDQGVEHAWNQSLHPTDAQLLFHLFCTFLDNAVSPVQNVRRPFTDRYVLDIATNQPNANLPAQIVQVSRRRPHFCLVVKNVCWDVMASRNNLFIALVLFVIQIDRECAGFLGVTNLGGKYVDLVSVIRN